MNRKSSYEASRDALKVVLFDEFIEVDTEELKGEQEMLAEYCIVKDSDDIILIILIPLFEESK